MIEPAAMDVPAIEIDDLRVDYGDTLAVDGLCLSIPFGEVFGLVGPNGAGKTSTFRVLATLLEPTYGRVRIAGHHTTDAAAAARAALGYMPDLAPVPSDLKVWEFLDIFAAAHGIVGNRRERCQECLEEVRLVEKRDVFCNELSRGMKQRLVLAKTLLHTPRVFVLDEPASGMDPVSRSALKATVKKLARRGSTVVISSHILGELSDMCSTIGLMQHGKLVDSGPVHDVADRAARGSRRFVALAPAGEGVRLAEALSATTLADEVDREGDRVFFLFHGTPADEAGFLRSLIIGGVPLRQMSEAGSALERAVLGLKSHPGEEGGRV
jgi:ABC-2 type transport system ATP-binding protein